MGKYEREMFAKQQKQLEIDRAEMHERNLKKMEEEAKFQPTPTIEEIHAATTPRGSRPAPEETVEDNDDTGKDKSNDGVAKTSTPADPTAGKYNTRDMSGNNRRGGK